MFGLSGGELFLVVFITLAVVSAPWAVRLGGALGELLARGKADREPPSEGKNRGGG